MIASLFLLRLAPSVPGFASRFGQISGNSGKLGAGPSTRISRRITPTRYFRVRAKCGRPDGVTSTSIRRFGPFQRRA